MKIAYEPHPVTPERKAELRTKGYTIIDARFAPADHVAEQAASESVADGGDKDALLAELAALGIHRDRRSSVEKLRAELEAAR